LLFAFRDPYSALKAMTTTATQRWEPAFLAFGEVALLDSLAPYPKGRRPVYATEIATAGRVRVLSLSLSEALPDEVACRLTGRYPGVRIVPPWSLVLCSPPALAIFAALPASSRPTDPEGTTR